MKKIISLKSIIFSLLLVTGSVSYSEPAIGTGTGPNSIIAGESNEATEEKSLAFGHGNKAKGKYSSAFGYMNETNGLRSSAFGSINKVDGKWSSVFGNQYEVTGERSGAFGAGSWDTGKYIYKNEGNNSYMIGNYNKIASGSNNNFILGNNVSIGSGIQNSVALGNNSTVSSSNEVSVGSASQKRKITNVADGEVSATSSDAVTGKQLYKVMQNSGALVMAALGHYKNRQAVAVGASYYFNDKFMMSTGVALSGEKRTEAMANVGFTLKIGKGSETTYTETPQYVVQNEVKRLTVENQELKERLRNLEEKLEILLKINKN